MSLFVGYVSPNAICKTNANSEPLYCPYGITTFLYNVVSVPFISPYHFIYNLSLIFSSILYHESGIELSPIVKNVSSGKKYVAVERKLEI